MARCEHGFERDVIPCVECGDRGRVVARAPVPQRANRIDAPRAPRAQHPAFIDRTGQVFQGALVLGRVDNNARGTACWLIRRPCGHERTITSRELTSPRSRWNCHVCATLKSPK